MPVGTSSRATSAGHTRPVQRTISSSGRRARPGCTRYQWPSSIPSEIAPRNAAPTSTRATDSQAGSPASMPAATRPGTATSGAIRSSTGGNSGTAAVGPLRVGAPVDAGHGHDPLAALGDALPLPRHARLATHDRHGERGSGRQAHRQRRRLAHRHGVGGQAHGQGARGHEDVDAAHQPAVADAHLAGPGRDPQEQQPARGPLQQDGGGVEADHGGRGYAGSPSRPVTRTPARAPGEGQAGVRRRRRPGCGRRC